MKRPISSYNKFLYKAVVLYRRLIRYLKWKFNVNKYTKTFYKKPLPFRIYKHQSVLVRKLGDADLQLQYNKVTNIKLSIEKLNGILIKPRETFSFFYLVGNPDESKGYLDGMMLSNGSAIAGVGGGICQIANLIHWLCLHSPLTITERHHHSFDPFPDSGRVVPFGCGASLFYNYIDYQFRNDTNCTVQLLFWLDEKCLNGDLRINEELSYKFHIEERCHEFICFDNQYYRKNEIWKKKIKKIGGKLLEEKCIQRNLSIVKYIPESFRNIENDEFESLKCWQKELLE